MPSFKGEPVIVDKPSDAQTTVAEITWESETAATSDIYLYTGVGLNNPILQKSLPEGTSFKYDKLLVKNTSVMMKIVLTTSGGSVSKDIEVQ